MTERCRQWEQASLIAEVTFFHLSRGTEVSMRLAALSGTKAS